HQPFPPRCGKGRRFFVQATLKKMSGPWHRLRRPRALKRRARKDLKDLSKPLAGEQLELSDLLRDFGGEDLMAVLRHQHVICEADTDPLEPRRFGGAVLGEVEPGLYRQYHARLQNPRSFVAPVLADVVDVHTEPVARAVHVKRPVHAFFDRFVEGHGKYAE